MAEHYRVLLVEDDQVDQMSFERFVRTENLPYDYTIASSIAEAKTVLASQSFDVALMDYQLGDGISLELFETAQHLPIIVITGSSDLKIAVQIMKSGAYDFLTKDSGGNYLTALPITVSHTIERWRAQQELNQYRNHLEALVEERTAALLEEELRLLSIVEATPTVVFSLDPNTKFTFVAGHSEDLLGHSPNALIGQSLDLLFARELEIQSGFKTALAGGLFWSDVEINGQWLSIDLSPKWQNESVTGVIGVVHDISERKEADLAIVQERNLLRTLIDSIPDYIFIKDREGRFVESNRAHAAGANISREEIIGRTAAEVFDPVLAEQFHADDIYVMTSGTSITNEERITTGIDGNKSWVLTTKIPLFDHDKNNIIGLVGISRDITDRRNAEEQRLHAERLHTEMEQQREILEMKQHFITTASHDFRTPLTIIMMCASTLEDYYDRLTPEKRLEKIRQIKSQVDRMVTLLDDVLKLSKANAGKVEYLPDELDLKPFCVAIWEDMIRVDQDKHQHNFEYTATSEQITADAHLLQQVLVNLLSNAFKYTPQGGDIQFLVTNDAQFLTFRVSDTGYGIPVADQKRLFEPFYRATNVKNIEGTGLGLAIVKAYIDLHSGTIAVQSNEDIGTTFTVQLPLHI